MNTCNQSQKQRKPRQTKPRESTYSFECFDSTYNDQTDEYTPAHTLFTFNHVRGDKSLTCQFIKIVKKICTKTSDGKYRCDPFYIMHKFEKQSAELKAFAQSVYDRIQKEAEETKAKSEYCFENRIPISQYNEFTRIFDGLTSSEAKKVYMRMVLLHHPDKGGEQAKFVQLQASYDRFVNFQKYLKMQNENRATETTAAETTDTETVPLCLSYIETAYLECVCVEAVYEIVYETVYVSVYETVCIEAVYENVYESDCESTADYTYENESI